MSASSRPGPNRRIPNWFKFVVCAVLSTVVLASLVAQEPFPNATGFINDYAGVLDTQVRASLEGLAQELQGKTGAEVAVAVLESLGDESLEDYSNRLAEHWGVGDQDDRGALLLLAIEDRRMRIEVGYGLEGVIPDGAAGAIRDDMTPYLRQGNYNAAVAVGVSSIAAAIAEDSGVTLSGGLVRSSRRQRSGGESGWLRLLLLLGVPFLFMRRRTVGGGWHGAPLAAAWMMGGMSRGIGGGYGGGGHGGGGFGGFGGGGFGGGGASGGW